MTTDPRTLIAEGRAHDEAMTDGPWEWDEDRDGQMNIYAPGKATDWIAILPRVKESQGDQWSNALAIAWFGTHRREMLTGHERALDEIDRLTKERDLCKRMLGDAAPEFARLQAENTALLATQERLVTRIAATDSPADIEATMATLEAARSRIECLETELAGARKAADWLEAKRTEALAEMERLRSENTELDEQRSSYRDRAQQLAGDVAGLRGEALGRRENPLTCTVARPGELTRECDATKPCAPCRISAGIAHLRTELGEAKLVIEQQDRDLERLRGSIAQVRDDLSARTERGFYGYAEDLDAILEGAPCTDATKTK
jgi:DNA repair exonuclease SbcCD ATPase subunit